MILGLFLNKSKEIKNINYADQTESKFLNLTDGLMFVLILKIDIKIVLLLNLYMIQK